LNASAFDLSGLTSLRLGSIGAQLGELVNEFSSDYTMSGNSNEAVPTEQAVRNYFGVVATNIVPVDDNVQTLGTSSKRWNHVYVGPGSITLGTLTITDDGGVLSVTGSGSNPAGAAINAISNGTSNVSVAEDSDVSITANGALVGTFASTSTTLEGDLQVKGNDLTTTQTSFNLLNATATTVNFAGAATTVSVGASTGTTTFNSTTASTDSTTGSVVVKGGLGVAGNSFFGGNLQVTGDILFGGEANQLSATQLNIDDPMVYLAHDNPADILDLGILAAYNDGAHKHAGIVRDHSDNTWKFFTNLSVEPGGTVSWGSVTYADVKLGGIVATGDVAVNGGDITTSATTFNLVNATATTLNIGGESTATTIGSALSGTTTVGYDLTVNGDVQVKGGDLTTNQTTFNLLNTTATTINFGGASTSTVIGSTSSGTTTVGYDLTVNGDVQVKGGDLTTNQTTFNLVNATATTVNIAGAGTTIGIGASSGTTTVNNDLNIATGKKIKIAGSYGTDGKFLQTISGGLQWADAAVTVSDSTTNSSFYPLFTTATSGTVTTASVSSTKLSFNPSSGALAVKGTFAIQGSSSGAVTFAVPSAAGSVTYTLPSADGTANQVLQTNGTGTLSWSTPSSGATISASSSSSTFYPTFAASTSGSFTTAYVVSSGFSFVPSTGTLTVTALTESSSIALKENVSPITGALDTIMQLVGVTYDRKDGSKKHEAGLIAEDVDRVLPNLVTHSDDGRAEGINYTKLTAYLIEAVKSLKAEIEQLKGNK
jgi:hypothetical protein